MSDVVLDGDAQVTVVCENLNVLGHDVLIDSAARRRPDGPRFRRALVHDEGDGLTVNFGNDYPGGSPSTASRPSRLWPPRTSPDCAASPTWSSTAASRTR